MVQPLPLASLWNSGENPNFKVLCINLGCSPRSQGGRIPKLAPLSQTKCLSLTLRTGLIAIRPAVGPRGQNRVILQQRLHGLLGKWTG